ncbi:MAG TPA: HAMP domain-containing sensor histidine kinase [Thermoanaerobaculia bacterium]|nr:HAMP domain-containing sensor histidine kinase [Thermoanaerobaculia bacterium]
MTSPEPPQRPQRSRWLMLDGRLAPRPRLSDELALPEPLREAPAPSVRPLVVALAAAALYSILFAVALLGLAAGAEGEPPLRWPLLGLAALNGAAFAGLALVILRRARRAEGTAARRFAELVQAEHSAASGMIASAVGHDLRNALQVARFSVDLLDNSGRVGDDFKALEQLRRSIDMMVDLAESLHTGSSTGFAGLNKRFDVVATLREVIAASAAHPALLGCEVSFEPARDIELEGVRRLLTRAVMNLVLNAAEAGPPGTRIVVSARVQGSELVIDVDDDGPGVPVAQRQRIFQPFYSTRERGGGLGLISAVACAEHHGGRIVVGDSPLGGARFELILPGARRAGDRERATAG